MTRSGINPPRMIGGDWRLALLAAASLAIVAASLARFASPGAIDRDSRVKGRDFLQFYVAGQFALADDAARLYDDDAFLERQQQIASIAPSRPRYYSLYPPMVALAFAPLPLLPYPMAFAVVAGVLTALLAFLVWHLAGHAGLTGGGRWAAVLSLPLYYPALQAVLNGQLTPWLLASLAFTFHWREKGRMFAAGVALSLLAIKPQFLVGALPWVLLARERRFVGGLLAGLGLQAGTVALFLGPAVWWQYVEHLAIYGRLARIYYYSPDYVHSLPGVLGNLFGHDRSVHWERLHLGVAAAALLLFLFAWRRHPGPLLPPLRDRILVPVFLLIVTPHLLVYDLALLLIPMAGAWPRHPPLTLTLLVATAAAPAYVITGFSVVPAILLAVLGWAAFAPIRSERVLD